MVVLIITAAAFVVAATRSNPKAANKEECTQQEQAECVEKNTRSEFLIESITRNLLGR